MYLHGEFINKKGDTIAVHIVTQGSKAVEKVIGGSPDSDFFFPAEDAVTITSEVNDTFDTLLAQSATVTLQARYFEPSLYGTTCRDGMVNILRNGKAVFAGYIEPLAYSQPYNEIYDEVSLNCVDCLSALQYSNYRDIGSAGVSYSSVKQAAGQRTFLEMLKEMVGGVTDGVDLTGSGSVTLWYDGSKTLTSAADYGILSGISIPELLFLGSEADDVWTKSDVAGELLKYLDLHLFQDGLTFWLFSWQTLRQGGRCTWKDLLGGGTRVTVAQERKITDAVAADCDTQFSIGEVYNQLVLTDNVTETENVVENPLDGDSLIPAFGNYQKYMTEYIAEGEGKTALGAFGGMVTGTGSDWSDAKQVDWYMWVKKHPKWKFYQTDEDGVRQDVYDSYCADGTDQHAVLSRCLNRGVGAAVVSFGSVEKQNGGSDNSPASAPDMKDTLVIGLGTDYHGDWNTKSDGYGSSTYLTDGTKILAACPVAEYTDNDSGGTFSPSDEATTNYIQISGKIALNPIMDITGGFNFLSANTSWGKDSPYWHDTVPSRNNGDGRYYAQRFWQAEHWDDEPTSDTACNGNQKVRGVYPFTGSGPQNYEYDYSATKEAKDTVSKVGVLQCMLVIGDKCVVETLPENGGSGNGEPDDFSWQTFKERGACSSDDEYYRQSFSIGFNPKLKDKIVGTEFDIQKNASYTVGVTVEGTLIPIRKSDKVSGKVRFAILGPVNEEWMNVTYRHSSFWRHSKYYTDSVALLAHCSSIMVSDLEVKAVSDNGKVGSGSSDKDIVYMSDTQESFVNKKDDLEFRITTALTTAERVAMGVQESVKLSAPLNQTSGDALLNIYDQRRQLQAKPEQLYVDAYWQEWHAPRVVLEQHLCDTVSRTGTAGTDLSMLDLWKEGGMDKTFYVQGMNRDLTEGTAEVTLREVFEEE